MRRNNGGINNVVCHLQSIPASCPFLFSNKSCLSINMNFNFSYSNKFLTSALIQKIEGIVKLSFEVKNYLLGDENN